MGAWDWLDNGPVTQAYKNYLGRDPDQGGFDYWTNVANTQGLDAAIWGIKQSPEAQGIQSPQEGGGEGGSAIDIPTDLFSHSSSTSSQQSGLPDWGNAWAKDFLDKYSPQIGGGLSSAFTALENPVQLNDAQKAQLQYFTNENLRPIVSNLGFRGVLNSTTGKDAIAKILATMGAKSYDEAIAQQQAKVAAYQKSQALLTAILEATRQSSGQSQSSASDPFEPWASMLPYLLGNPNE